MTYKTPNRNVCVTPYNEPEKRCCVTHDTAMGEKIGICLTHHRDIVICEALSAQAKQIFEEIASSSKIGEVRDEESTIIFQTFTIRWDAWQNLKAKWCK